MWTWGRWTVGCRGGPRAGADRAGPGRPPGFGDLGYGDPGAATWCTGSVRGDPGRGDLAHEDPLRGDPGRADVAYGDPLRGDATGVCGRPAARERGVSGLSPEDGGAPVPELGREICRDAVGRGACRAGPARRTSSMGFPPTWRGVGREIRPRYRPKRQLPPRSFLVPEALPPRTMVAGRQTRLAAGSRASGIRAAQIRAVRFRPDGSGPVARTPAQAGRMPGLDGSGLGHGSGSRQDSGQWYSGRPEPGQWESGRWDSRPHDAGSRRAGLPGAGLEGAGLEDAGLPGPSLRDPGSQNPAPQHAGPQDIDPLTPDPARSQPPRPAQAPPVHPDANEYSEEEESPLLPWRLH